MYHVIEVLEVLISHQPVKAMGEKEGKGEEEEEEKLKRKKKGRKRDGE